MILSLLYSAQSQSKLPFLSFFFKNLGGGGGGLFVLINLLFFFSLFLNP